MCSPPARVQLLGGTCAHTEIQSLIPEAVSQEEHEDRARHGVSPGTISNDMPNSIAFTATSDGRIWSPFTQTLPAPVARQRGTGGHLSGHPWVSKHSRGRVIRGPAPQGTARTGVRKGRRTSSPSVQRGLWAPVSAPHTEVVGKPGASCLLLQQELGAACPVAMTSAFRQKGQWLGNMP